jgi:hypothetical protein
VHYKGGEPEWQIMANLVPKVFDRIARDELDYFETLPAWASAAVNRTAASTAPALALKCKPLRSNSCIDGVSP